MMASWSTASWRPMPCQPWPSCWRVSRLSGMPRAPRPAVTASTGSMTAPHSSTGGYAAPQLLASCHVKAESLLLLTPCPSPSCPCDMTALLGKRPWAVSALESYKGEGVMGQGAGPRAGVRNFEPAALGMDR